MLIGQTRMSVLPNKYSESRTFSVGDNTNRELIPDYLIFLNVILKSLD